MRLSVNHNAKKATTPLGGLLTASEGRWLVALLLALGLAFTGGCGGIGPVGPTEPTAAIVVVDAVDAETKNAIPVEAVAICGGVRGTITVSEGSVVLRDVPFGTGTPPVQPLTVTAPGYVTFAEPIQISVTVVTFYTAEMQEADPAETGTVTGVIRSTTGQTLISALVKFTQTTVSGVTEVRGYTDNTGAFIIGGIPIGLNRVSAEALGYVTSEQQVNVVQDAGGGINAPLQFDLLPGSTTVDVTGTVFNAFNQMPLAGANVTLGSQPAVTTNAAGAFVVPGVTVGAQPLRVTYSGYDDYEQQLNVIPGMGQVRVGMTPSAPQPPGSPYNVAGKVTLHGPADNSGALVTAVEIATAREQARVTTPASGEYQMFLPPGEYRLTVQYGAATVRRTITVPTGGRVLNGIDFILTIVPAA